MENTLGGAARGSIPTQSAVQNGIPLLWGVMKALQEPGNLMP